MIALSLCRLVHRHIPGFQVWQVRGGRVGAGEDPTADLIPVAFASLSLFQEGPYEGVDNVRLVLLQPVAGPRDDVETEVIPDVESACLGHFLLQEGIPLTPQQQHWRPDMILAQGEGAERRKKKRVVSEKETLFSSI